ncbi:MAG TPA: RNA polymerase sigma-70 factor [Prolixibacteraceae bacterium]|jgi:RNA polymerase sigma-70 factor (ECF subfamily)
MDPTDDLLLFRKLNDGDQLAFKALFQKYYPALCHFAAQWLHDPDLGEETVEDLFVNLWEKRASLSIESSVKHYLFRSVRNHCLNHLQAQKIRQQYASRMIESPQPDFDPEQCYLDLELTDRIEMCIRSLPPRRQEIFRLSREQGFKYKDIADELNISIKTVEAQMGLALKHLRENLKDLSNHWTLLFIIFKK